MRSIVVAQQTEPQLPIRRQTHPSTSLTEGLSDAADKAQRPHCSRNTERATRVNKIVTRFFQGTKRGLDARAVIGDALRSHTDGRQVTEVTIAADVLNRMLELGRPEYVRIA